MVKKARRNVKQLGIKEKPAELFDLSDDLLNRVLRYLTLEELLSAHTVSRRFHKVLSRPDPSVKVYGSPTITIRNWDSPSSNQALTRFLVTRSGGFTGVQLRAAGPFDVNQEEILNFFKAGLPQLAGLFAQQQVNLEIDIQDGGTFFFEEEEEEEEFAAQHFFLAEYWQLLAPTLTRLSLRSRGDLRREIPKHGITLLLSLRNLQVLELIGGADLLDMPEQVGWPLLRVLRLERFNVLPHFQLDCPALEALYLTDFCNMELPSGLAACSRLSVLELTTPDSRRSDFGSQAELVAALVGMRATLEELNISGLRLTALPPWLGTFSRLHTLRARDNCLTELPVMPVSLKTLDLWGNRFTEMPSQLEALSQLTSLSVSSAVDDIELGHGQFQITRELDRIIRLPQLKLLTLLPEMEREYADGLGPRDIWNAQSLSYLGLAQYEIFRTESKLELRF